jgi:carbonic anhydrase
MIFFYYNVILMSDYATECGDATSPVDIKKSSVNKSCKNKCKFQFDYGNSSCNVTNKGDHLSIAYDTTTSNQAQLNSQDYYVTDVRIYRPSLHTYNGSHADAEIIILHQSDHQNMLVSIPLSVSESANGVSNLLTTIISNTHTHALNEGDKTTINTSDFNLDTFIPQSPFYAYIGTLPWQPCTGNYSYIVFDTDSSILSISSISIDQLKKLITTTDITTKSNYLYYNEDGPTNSSADEIYIDCNPVFDSTDILPPESTYYQSQSNSSTSTSGSGASSISTLEEYGMIIGGVIIGLFAIKVFQKMVPS